MRALEQALGGPAIEVVAKATRRRFTVEYKRTIVREADACKTSGTVGALLRREGLYSSHLTTWRAARARGELAGPAKKRGPVPRVVDARDQRITELEREGTRWRKRAERAEALGRPAKTSGGVAGNAEHRTRVMAPVTQIGPQLGIGPTCAALGLPRATYYRRRRPPRIAPPRRPSPRALGERERAAVLEQLHTRFGDLAPAEVYATLLDEGTYLCSERMMYHLLAANAEVRERRDQLRHPAYAAPELLASRPKELWSWDITKLLGPAKWTYFYLYVMLDVFSRYVVGWMVNHAETATLAERFIDETCARQGIGRDELTIHADRGAAMTSKSVVLLLADLGVTKTHSRPHVSMTTRSRRPTSKPPSTSRPSRTASARSKTPGPTARVPSPGITLSTTTAAWVCSRPTTCTSAWPSSDGPSAPSSSPRRTRPIPNGFRWPAGAGAVAHPGVDQSPHARRA